jgi:hypothetical protein
LPALDLPAQWEFVGESDNALVIQNWKFAMAGAKNRDFYLPDFPSDDWLEYTIGGWELQLPRERDDETYPVDILYKISFTAQYIAEDIKMLIDGFKCRSYDLYINGSLLRDRGRKSSLDAEIREVSIGQYLKEGINDISIKMTVEKKTNGLLDFAKLTGNFALKPSPNGYVMVPRANVLQTGSWTEQGYPFYSGTGVYTSHITVPGEYLDNRELFLCIDCGRDIAEVRLNGRDAGRRLWAPYRFKVSELLQKGENSISVRITNTMFNLLEGIPQPSGIFGGRIECFNRFKVPVPE